MATNNAAKPTKVITGEVRLAYANLLTPRAPQPGADPKFSTVLLIPKEDTATIKKIKRAQQAALEEGAGKVFGGKIPKVWKNTLRDGDEEADLERNPEYEGMMFMNVSSKTKPGLVDRSLAELIDQTEVYSGMYARVSINAFAYSFQGSKGVSFGLNNVQKLRDGEAFAGSSRAADDFDALDDDDDDDDLI